MNYSTIAQKNPLSMISSAYRNTTGQSTIRDKLPDSLVIFNSMTGGKIETSLYAFNTMDILKKYIADSFDIPIENLFLLTPYGIKLRFSMVVNEEISEIYVYDRKFFNTNNLKYPRDEINKNTKLFLEELNKKELINMIKPMTSPIISDELSKFVSSLDTLLNSKENIQSSEIDLNLLRLLLNSLRRNSGWAAALLSDFRKTLSQDQSLLENGESSTSLIFNNEDIQIMISSLNVLIQHIDLAFKALEKKYNSSIDSLIHLESNSMIDSWKEHYMKLKKINFEYSKPGGGLESLRLSDLIDEKLFDAFALESRTLADRIHASLLPIRERVEKEVIILKYELAMQYDTFRNDFLNISSDDGLVDKSNADQASDVHNKIKAQQELITKSRDIVADLEDYVQQVVKGTKDLPSFEDLITTTGQNAGQLSISSIENTKKLVDIYKFQGSIIVPKISKLANELYDIQISKLNARQELQTKLISETLVLITRIQSNSGMINRTINNELDKNLKTLEDNELQLSIVSDLPLLFGIWSIANLNNVKWGTGFTKLAQRTNEILEMMKFVETGNRSKWLSKFLENTINPDTNNQLTDVEFLNLSDIERQKFIYSHINNIRFVIENSLNSITVDANNSGNSVNNNSNNSTNPNPVIMTPTRRLTTGYTGSGSQAVGHIISPLNKLIQNINGIPGKYGQVTTTSNNSALPEVSPGVHQKRDFLANLGTFITVDDVSRYIKSLRDAGIDEKIVLQLESNVSDFGISGTPQHISTTRRTSDGSGEGDVEEEQVVIKKNNVQGLGSFDASDVSFMKLFEKFLKSFEIDGVHIGISISRDDNEVKDETKEELIKGYETRIKKLENLLHQQKFRSFNDQWSQAVSNVPQNSSANMNEGTNASASVGQNTVLFSEAEIGTGRKMISLPPSHLGEKVKDLTKANNEMTEEIKNLKDQLDNQENGTYPTRKTLNDNVESLKQELKDMKKKYENDMRKKDSQIKQLEQQLETSSSNRRDIKEDNAKLEKENKDLAFMKSDLLANLSEKEREFNKESEMNQKEINELKLRVEELEEDESNLIETARSLGERIAVKDQLLMDLYELTQCLYHKLNSLSKEIFSNLTRCCLLLESIGLLLIRETPSLKGNPGFLTIKRVKGLRSKKKAIKLQEGISSVVDASATIDEDTEQPMDNALLEVVSSEVVPEAEHYLHWLDTNVVDGFTLSSDFGIEDSKPATEDDLAVALNNCDKTNCEESQVEKKIKKLLNNYTRLNIEEGFSNFINYNRIDNQLVVEKVYRRFNDVESLARKLQKEKNFTKSELKTTRSELSTRVVLRNFKVGDLALFLKTLGNNSNNSNLSELNHQYSGRDGDGDGRGGSRSKPNSPSSKSLMHQPWAAFNVGAPNYYLSNNRFVDPDRMKLNESYIDLGGRDWMLARIVNIESKNVTDHNFNNVKENPYGLMKGSTWYLVEAIEEKLFGQEG